MKTQEDRSGNNSDRDPGPGRSRQGFLLIGLGVLILLGSFSLTFFTSNAHPGPVLYGMTTVGALMVLGGMVYIFE